jgi:hypothetical protein
VFSPEQASTSISTPLETSTYFNIRPDRSREPSERKRGNVMIKRRLFMALIAGGVSVAASFQDVDCVDKCDPSKADCVPAIAFTSTRDGDAETYVLVTMRMARRSTRSIRSE